MEMEMEMGSSSSTESLNGLKFGRKIYFEDHSSSACSAGGSGSGPGPKAGQPKKVRSSPVQAGQPPRCQVEGCKVDLSDAKAYYSRHKVCGMHSKSPKVVVAGIEQRFCQQCSRFHQLPEFDQGKRSCRRRLAGHNERRRKPPPGSLLSTRYEAGGIRSGSFLMDFTAYPRLGREAWPAGGQGTVLTGKYLPYHPWQPAGGGGNNSENPPPPSDLFLQTSGSIAAGHGHGIPSPAPPPLPPPPAGECISVVADSSCALSLLSNRPWGSRARPPTSVFGLHSMMGNGVPPHASELPTGAGPHGGGTVSHFPAASWGAVKGENMGGGSSHHHIIPDLGLGHIPQPLTGQFSGELELSQQGRRPYLEPGHSRDFDSASHQNMNWSL